MAVISIGLAVVSQQSSADIVDPSETPPTRTAYSDKAIGDARTGGE